MRRGQGALAILATVVIVAGALSLQRLGPRARASAPPGRAVSGAWYCPHGGGPGWSATLQIANPGSQEASVRVTNYDPDGASPSQSVAVAPGSVSAVDVAAGNKGSATMVEYFGSWVAAGWVTQAGGSESGVAAEPCLPSAGRRFFMPDGTTQAGQNAYVIVMNPFAAEAVFTLDLLTASEPPTTTTDISNVVLRPYRSVAFEINQVRLMDTVAVRLTVNLGRVAAASLGVSSTGGIREVGGVPDPSTRWILPGGLDTNNASVVVMDPGQDRAQVSAAVYAKDVEQTAAGLQSQTVDAERARTFSVVTSSPSTIDIRSTAPVIATRRTAGVSGDQGALAGATQPASSWLVLPAVSAPPYDVRLLLANPGSVDAIVAVSSLGPGGAGAKTNVRIPAHRTALVPTDFTNKAPTDAFSIEASQGVVVPVTTAYSSDHQGYAVAMGVPVPGL